MKAAVFLADSRAMPELADNSIHLMITSPPYYHIKDYGIPGQIGYGQSLHEYLVDLARVWAEVARVLAPGGRACVNIGDQFARAAQFGRYKVIPLHAEVIAAFERAGLDYMGSIIWRKKTTMRTTGGAVVMGSYPYPPNGMVEIDYEFILIFKKPGRRKIPKELKERARLTKEEWKSLFSGHWEFPGERKRGHEAPFPLELPVRLIKMFSVPGDLVLDPFLGTGTTALAALSLGRRFVGYELNSDYVDLMKEKLGLFWSQVELHRREEPAEPAEPPPGYRPMARDMKPVNPDFDPSTPGKIFRVREISEKGTLFLSNGQEIAFRGISLKPKGVEFLRRILKGKYVYLKGEHLLPNGVVEAYVFLKNRLFINKRLIRDGLAQAKDERHPKLKEFNEVEKDAGPVNFSV